MKGTDFRQLYKQLEAREKDELIAAVKAHGGEYIFFDCSAEVEDIDEDWRKTRNNECIPIILASFRWDDEYSDFYVTRIKVEGDKYLSIYGLRKEGGFPEDEDILDMVHVGHIHYITEEIPETESVKGVTIASDRDKLYNLVSVMAESLGEITNHDDMPLSDKEIDSLYEIASEARDIMENGNF